MKAKNGGAMTEKVIAKKQISDDIIKYGIFLFISSLVARLIFALGSMDNPIFSKHDDAFYYYKIAWNIIHGNGVCFTPGIPTNGFHPLWLIILLPIYAIVPKQNLYLPIYLSGVVTAIAVSIAIIILYKLIVERYKSTNPLTVFLLFCFFGLNPNIIYYQMCGMETGFALLLFSVALYSHYKLINSEKEDYGKHFKIWALSNILLLWARIDYATIVWLLNIHLLWKWRSKKLLGYIIVINLSILPWVLWCKIKFGNWVPISGVAFNFVRNNFFLITHGKKLSTYLFMYLRELKLSLFPALFRSFGGLVGLGGITLIISLGYRELKHKVNSISIFYLTPFLVWILVYGIILHWLIRILVRDYYYVPIHFLIFLLLVEIILSTKNHIKKIIFIATMIVMFVSSVILFKNKTLIQAKIPYRDVKVIENISDIDSTAIVGAFNAGRLGYFAHFKVINLDGAVNPYAYYYIKKRKLWEYIEKSKINILADSPYPIWERYYYFMGNKNYLGRLIPIKYFQDVAVPYNDLGFFRIIDSLSIPIIEKFINTNLCKYRSTYYMAKGLERIGKKKSALLLLYNYPFLPDSIAKKWDKPENRTLGDIMWTVKQAILEMGVKNPKLMRSKAGFYWKLKRGNAKIFVELIPLKKKVLIFVHSPLVSLPKNRTTLFKLENFVMHQNDIIKTGQVKFHIRGNILFLGVSRPVAYIEKYEIKYMINQVSKLADMYNDLIAKKFGCKLFKG